jgi:hypothetical protein
MNIKSQFLNPDKPPTVDQVQGALLNWWQAEHSNKGNKSQSAIRSGESANAAIGSNYTPGNERKWEKKRNKKGNKKFNNSSTASPNEIENNNNPSGQFVFTAVENQDKQSPAARKYGSTSSNPKLSSWRTQLLSQGLIPLNPQDSDDDIN